jgi:hydrogenase maturation protease
VTGLPRAEVTRLLDSLAAEDCLVYGIGNVGRQDDGLGWAFVDWLESTGRCSPATLHRGYQPVLEDAELVSRFARVLFVDATKDAEVADAALSRPEPAYDVPFSSHALTVPTVLATARLCFDAEPEAWLLALRGHSFDLEVGLTDGGRASLAAAGCRGGGG